MENTLPLQRPAAAKITSDAPLSVFSSADPDLWQRTSQTVNLHIREDTHTHIQRQTTGFKLIRSLFDFKMTSTELRAVCVWVCVWCCFSPTTESLLQELKLFHCNTMRKKQPKNVSMPEHDSRLSRVLLGEVRVGERAPSAWPHATFTLLQSRCVAFFKTLTLFQVMKPLTSFKRKRLNGSFWKLAVTPPLPDVKIRTVWQTKSKNIQNLINRRCYPNWLYITADELSRPRLAARPFIWREWNNNNNNKNYNKTVCRVMGPRSTSIPGIWSSVRRTFRHNGKIHNTNKTCIHLSTSQIQVSVRWLSLGLGLIQKYFKTESVSSVCFIPAPSSLGSLRTQSVLRGYTPQRVCVCVIQIVRFIFRSSSGSVKETFSTTRPPSWSNLQLSCYTFHFNTAGFVYANKQPVEKLVLII